MAAATLLLAASGAEANGLRAQHNSPAARGIIIVSGTPQFGDAVSINQQPLPPKGFTMGHHGAGDPVSLKPATAAAQGRQRVLRPVTTQTKAPNRSARGPLQF